MPDKKPATPQFYFPPRQASGLAHRASGAAMAEAKAALALLPEEERTFPTTQILAERYRINGQVVWRLAQALGCPPRNFRRASRCLTPAAALEAERRWNAGEELNALAREFNCKPSTLRGRLEQLAEDREDAARAKAEAVAKALLVKPKAHQSDFIRPLSHAALTGGRARPATRERNCDPAP